MPNIGRIIGVAEAIRTPTVAVCAPHCTHRYHQASSCLRCVQVCRAQAMTVSADGPRLDPIACSDCGACASVCPTGAIVPLKPADPALAAKIATSATLHSRVTFACAQLGLPGNTIVTLPCLARLDPSLLVLAFAKGAASVSLCTGVCDDCPGRRLGSHLSSVVAEAQRHLEAFGLPGRIDLGEGLERPEPEPEPEQPVGLTRRGLFDLLRKGGTVYAAKAVEVLLPEPGAAATEANPRRRENPVHLPAQRERLLESLRALVPQGSARRETRLAFVAPELDPSRCNGCALCGRVCPTGALSIEEDAEGDILRITCQESACVDCGLCVETCRQQALSLAPVSAARVLARDAQGRTLFERAQHEAEPLVVSVEDKMKKLLGVAVYRN
jgi:ferredoxin